MLRFNSSLPLRSASAVLGRTRGLSSRATAAFNRFNLTPGQEVQGWYDGTWRHGSGQVVESYNPATGALLARVRGATQEEVSQTLDKAREAYVQWRHVPAPQRGVVLQEIGRALEEYKDDIGAIVSAEMGKIATEGKGEVQEIIDIVGYAVGLSRSIGGVVLPSERAQHFITEVSNPLGVCGVISAFNFPTAVYGWNFALSFTVGNATVWKPAPTTSLSAIATTKVITGVLEKHGLPGALSALVCGGTEAGQKLVSDKRVDLLSFTGSEATGRKVGQEVQGRFGKSILELGGNNAAIVLPDANLPMALRTIVFSALGTAGQRCTTTRRLFLHSSIADDFLPKLVTAYKSVTGRMGDPLADDVLVGPLHARAGVDNFKRAIEEAKKQGGEVLVGGEACELAGELQGGNFVQPTIVRVPNGGRDTPIMQEETFAPILYVSTFETLEEAIELNNSVAQGLSSSLFTQDMSNAFKWIGPGGSDCGIVNVNGSTSGAEIGGPFGGNKSTGWGRESGGEAWKMYCRQASCTLNYSNEVAMAQGVKFE